MAAATASPSDDIKPLMAERGALLLKEDFTSSPLGAEWKTLKGTWEMVGGAIKGSERTADQHAGVLAREVKCHDLIAQFDFKLAGARSMAFSLNSAKGHVCRVTITPTGFIVQKDKTGKNSEDKSARLDTVNVVITSGEWHTMLVEVCGKEMVACMDGQQTGFGTHEGIDVDKTSIRFPVGGEAVFLRNLRLWEAHPAAGWEAKKKELESARSKKP